MKTADLRKQRLRQKRRIDNMSSPSLFQNKYREDWFYSYGRDKERLKSDKKRNFASAERPLLLPPLPNRTVPEQISKRADEFVIPVKTRSHKTFPKYLPKIETRKAELNEVIKEIDAASSRKKNAEKIISNNPPLRKRAVKPVRAAISTSATLRGLVTLDLEEQFIFRFRLSNYDVKDINISTLNEPV